MPSLHVVIIWFLSALFGGSLITLAVLYVTRDAGQHAAEARSARARRIASIHRWRHSLDAAREHMVAAGPLDVLPERPPVIDGAAVAALTEAMIAGSDQRVWASVSALRHERAMRAG